MDIRALARHLNLSIGTVSRALNDRPDVSPDTRRRVMEAADLHGYSPNQSGRALRSGRTGAIAFMLTLRHESASYGDPFFMSLFEGVSNELATEKLDLMVLLTREGENQFEALQRGVARGLADGWLLSSTEHEDPRIPFLIDRKIPFATLGRSMSGGNQPWIDLDFEDVIGRSVRHLAGLGHRRIALVTQPVQLNNSHVSVQSFRQEMQSAGLAADDRLIIEGDTGEREGEAATISLLGLPDRPTAMIMLGENAPVGAYQALRSADLVPGTDMAIVGLRDSPACLALQPSLTCFTLSLARLGRTLGRALLGVMADGQADFSMSVQKLWPMEFRVGQSSGVSVITP